MSSCPSTMAFEMETGNEQYGRMSCWVCIYFCLSHTVLFLKGAGCGFCISTVGAMVLSTWARKADAGFPVHCSLRHGNGG